MGSRVALAILSALEPADLMRAIASGDKAMVARANGVGPKLAQRIVMELKDKVGGIVLAPGSGGGVAASAGAGADAVSALLNLGFRPAEANAAVAAAEEELGAGRRWMRWCGWPCARRRSSAGRGCPVGFDFAQLERLL
ncbi:hypothetical protein GCM10020258_07950 [Sphingomonas yabuuchiae]